MVGEIWCDREAVEPILIVWTPTLGSLQKRYSWEEDALLTLHAPYVEFHNGGSGEYIPLESKFVEEW